MRVFLLESRLSNHLTVRCSFMRYDFITRIRLIGLRVLLLESRLSNHLTVRCSFMRYDFITWICLIGLRVLLLENRLSNHLMVRCSFMRYNFIIWIRLIGFESALAWKLVVDSNITWKQENCKICTSYSILSRWKEVITGV